MLQQASVTHRNVHQRGSAVLTRDEVIWGYRYILGREPESEAVVNATAAAVDNFREFRRILLGSAEFDRICIQSRASWFQRPVWVAAPVFGGLRLLWIDLSDRFVSLGCLQDGYELVETNFLKRILRNDDVFLDIGANVGWYTLLASTIIDSHGHIYAFEPHRPTVEYLQRTVALNNLNSLIDVYPIGLAKESKTELLAWVAGTGNGGAASLGGNSVLQGMNTQSIEVRPLDSLGIARVNVIKIDVEGAELLVMEGATRILDRDRPIVMSEVLPGQLQRVSGCTPEDYFGYFACRHYRAYILDTVRCGERIDTFPNPWHKELVNVAFIPGESPIDDCLFKALI
jgi:FkbM family methyltransferase